MTSPGAEFAFVCSGEVLTRFTLAPGEYVIGRAANCEIAIDLDGIGERHAQLSIGERLVLRDLGDEPGTFIAGQRVTSTALLDAGDEVQLGTAGVLRVEVWIKTATNPTESPVYSSENQRELASIRGLPMAGSLEKSPPSPTSHADVAVAHRMTTAAAMHVDATVESPPSQPKGGRGGKKSKWRQKRKTARSETRPATPIPTHPPVEESPEFRADGKPLLILPTQTATAEAASGTSPAKVDQILTAPSPAEREKSIELIDAEIRRLRLALVDEMDRRRRAEKWANVASEAPAPFPDTPVQGCQRRPWNVRQKAAAASVLILAAATWLSVNSWARKRAEEARAATHTVKILRPAAEQFAAAAEERVDEQDWEGACQQLEYALILAPERSGWRSHLGDIWLARFELERALANYRQAAAADARLSEPWDGITVCERLLRAREVSGSPSESALYTIHRALVRHGRLAEAVKVARKLPRDVNLQQRTWKERLEKAGLDADVQINDESKITVRLRGAVQEKLDLLRGIPATALWMPETDAHDLTPLAGIPLEELDISRTMVVKVDALRDMPLRRLNLDRTQVEDLLPLRGSPVEELHLCHTPVRSIASLRSMPLRKLDISYTRVSDLQPLATVPLRELDASGTVVTDLSPLSHLPLTTVRLDDTRVVDLLPLHGAPITVLSLARTPITSIEALTQTPIAVLSLSGCTQLRDLTPLSRLKDLQKFILPPATNTKEVQAILPQVRFLE